jgi:hypothetical protein
MVPGGQRINAWGVPCSKKVRSNAFSTQKRPQDPFADLFNRKSSPGYINDENASIKTEHGNPYEGLTFT